MMKIETAPYSIQTIGKQYIDMLSPTATVLDIAKMSPSMNVSTADTSGMQGGQIQSRGLTDADMGLMLNGAPATAANYLNEDADAENVERVTVTPSSSRIDLPVTAAAGGVLDETTHTPLDKAGGMVDFSYGTNNMSREFIRLESGDIAHSGMKGYFSFSNTHARSWLGAGINDRKHIDFGLRKSWANGSTSDFFISWNSEDFVIDVKPTVAQFEQYKHTGVSYGRNAEYVSGNYWKNNIDHWNQIFLSAHQHFVITPHVTLDITPYYTLGRGWDGSNGGTTSSATPYYYADGMLAPAGTQLTSYFQQYADERVGVMANFGVDLDRHNRLQFGYWFENYATPRGLPKSFTMSDGENPSPNWEQYMVFVKNAAGQLVHNTIYTNAGDELHSLFIEDAAKYFQDRLTVAAGFKYVMTNYWDNVVSTSSNRTYGTNTTAPLPHLSIGYHFDRENQIYLNAEGDFRQPSPNALTINSKGEMPKPQYSIKEELGYRYAGPVLIVDLSFFNINITNRLLTTYTSTTQSGTINAGNQTSRGFDAMLSTHPWHHFSPFFGFEYLHSTFDTNIPYATSYLPTKGKQAIASPHVITSAGLSYDDGHFFGNLSLKYVGPQSVTLVGDQRMPGYMTDSVSIGYHFKPISFMKSPTFRLNFRNLTGSVVRSSIYGTAINRYAVTLINGMAGPSTGSGAQFWLEPRFSMTGTISTSF
ncbi:TonB-dependent receptor plug domain-containing protein [Gluconacetobacter asukensis]|uniref:TonB-dependent receptor plug domain-containing protein n=2 Tax=Gluconacetobacter asukensis TaxID=1017181 RepID=A0A7W4J1V4_9PROT|nr:TonB-dependent receptor plug domain-containing protein [Gluconacetobacter asukensis]